MTQTKAQRMSALRKGNDVRFKRAALKRQLREGHAYASSVILKPPGWAEGMRVHDALMALYKFGQVRWARVARASGIRFSTTFGDLTDRQADLIVNELTELGYS